MRRSFLDTNILVYGFEPDDHRQPEAMRLIRSDCVIGVQCLNEFAFVSRRKRKLTWQETAKAIRIIAEFTSTIIPLTLDVHRLGLRLAERHTLSVYDGMIVAAALTADCDVLYSEDMHAGLVIDGRLTIANPFAAAA